MDQIPASLATSNLGRKVGIKRRYQIRMEEGRRERDVLEVTGKHFHQPLLG